MVVGGYAVTPGVLRHEPNAFSQICAARTHYVALKEAITERNKAAVLRDSEARFRKLFDLESDAIVVVDSASNVVVQANLAAPSRMTIPWTSCSGCRPSTSPLSAKRRAKSWPQPGEIWSERSGSIPQNEIYPLRGGGGAPQSFGNGDAPPPTHCLSRGEGAAAPTSGREPPVVAAFPKNLSCTRAAGMHLGVGGGAHRIYL